LSRAWFRRAAGLLTFKPSSALPVSALAVSALLAAGAVVVLPTAANAAGATYYVSTSGSDSNAGTSLGTPFLTINRCAQVATAGSTCLIEGGTYHETVTPANSGSSGAPITFAPYDGESVTVDGADPVTGWTQYSGDIYQASVALPVDEDSASGFLANQIFVRGAMAPEAQWPAPSGNLMDPSYEVAPSTTNAYNTITDSALPGNVDWDGAVVNVRGSAGWTAETGIVSSYTTDSVTYTWTNSYDNDCFANCEGAGEKYYITGNLSLLTQADEWYYDHSTQKLYLWAPGGVNPSTLTVEAKERNDAFDLAGRSDIDITGLHVFASTIYTDPNSSHNVINGTSATYVSHFTTQPDGPNTALAPGCGVYCAHETDSGIILDGTDETLKNSTIAYSAGNGVALVGTGTVIQNNVIHDTDYIGGYEAAVRWGPSGQGTVTGNTIYNTGRDGINVNLPTAYDAYNRISDNNIYDFGYLETDEGGLYICCGNVDGDGTRIDHNWVHDGQASNENTGGIYIDNSAYNFEVDHNVVWNTHSRGITVNANTGDTDDNLIYNNTIGANVTYDIGGISGGASGTVVENNLFAYGSTAENNGLTGVTFTDNLTPANADSFVNPAFSDYRLVAASAAINAGDVISGITDGYSGSAPDIGAYEYNDTAPYTDWTAGSTLATGGPTYSFWNEHAQLNLEIPADSTTEGTDADLWTWHGGTNQEWTLTPQGNNAYSVANLNSGLVLEIYKNSSAAGARADQWAWNGGANQQWTIADSGGVCVITNVHSGLILEDYANSTSLGAAVDQGPANGAANQEWAC
jgi:hypothetical protein